MEVIRQEWDGGWRKSYRTDTTTNPLSQNETARQTQERLSSESERFDLEPKGGFLLRSTDDRVSDAVDVRRTLVRDIDYGTKWTTLYGQLTLCVTSQTWWLFCFLLFFWYEERLYTSFRHRTLLVSFRINVSLSGTVSQNMYHPYFTFKQSTDILTVPYTLHLQP